MAKQASDATLLKRAKNFDNELRRIADNNIHPGDLFNTACAALKDGDLPPRLRQFFGDVRDSTRHAAILGCGPEIDYALLRKEAAELVAQNGLISRATTDAEYNG